MRDQFRLLIKVARVITCQPKQAHRCVRLRSRPQVFDEYLRTGFVVCD